jgi:hypothetical protein
MCWQTSHFQQRVKLSYRYSERLSHKSMSRCSNDVQARLRLKSRKAENSATVHQLKLWHQIVPNLQLHRGSCETHSLHLHIRAKATISSRPIILNNPKAGRVIFSPASSQSYYSLHPCLSTARDDRIVYIQTAMSSNKSRPSAKTPIPPSQCIQLAHYQKCQYAKLHIPVPAILD